MASIDIIFYIQSEDRKKTQKMIDGVLSQNMSEAMRWIVYGNISETMKKMFAGKYEIVFIVQGSSLKDDYKKIVSELKSDYFTIITDDEEWTDEKYIHTALATLDEFSEFSMYGANTYDEVEEEYAYDLHGEKFENLYDFGYQKYINFGIDDFFYHLVENKEKSYIIIPQAIIYRKYDKAYEELFENQEEYVLKKISFRKLLYFVNLKYGMSLLTPNIIGYSDVDKIPKWKKHMLYAMIVYAIRNIYAERNPRWTSEYVEIEYYFGIKSLRKEIEMGFVPTDDDLQQIEFVSRLGRELPKGTPFIIKSLGEKNPEKIFLVLEFERRCYGLFATVFMMLGMMKYADENHLTPVVDFKNHYVRLLQNSQKRFKENSWEYYFEQPESGVDLDEVYESKNVMFCDEHGWSNPTWYDLLPTEKKVVNEWNEIICKYLHLKPEVQQYVDKCYQKILAGKKNILGVSVRANILWHHKNKDELIKTHPVQAELDEIIQMIEMHMQKWNAEWIFLVVDDDFYFQKILSVFQDKCLYLERVRGQYFLSENDTNGLEKAVDLIRKQGIENNNIDYICETYLLAKCHSLLAANCGCSRMAYFLNNNEYEHVEIIDKGRY